MSEAKEIYHEQYEAKLIDIMRKLDAEDLDIEQKTQLVSNVFGFMIGACAGMIRHINPEAFEGEGISEMMHYLHNMAQAGVSMQEQKQKAN